MNVLDVVGLIGLALTALQIGFYIGKHAKK